MKELPYSIIYQPKDDIDDYLDIDPDGLNATLCELMVQLKDLYRKINILDLLNDAYWIAKRTFIDKHPRLSGLEDILSAYVSRNDDYSNEIMLDSTQELKIPLAYVILTLQSNLKDETIAFLPTMLKGLSNVNARQTIENYVESCKSAGKVFHTDLKPKMILYSIKDIKTATNDFSLKGIENLLRIYDDMNEQQDVLRCIQSSYEKINNVDLDPEGTDLPF